MTLTFPNPTRTYDETRNAVRFTGHDGMFEVRFFVEAGALAAFGAGSRSVRMAEAACLSAFDASRKAICDVASKAYARSRRPSYVLTEADFG